VINDAIDDDCGITGQRQEYCKRALASGPDHLRSRWRQCGGFVAWRFFLLRLIHKGRNRPPIEPVNGNGIPMGIMETPLWAKILPHPAGDTASFFRHPRPPVHRSQRQTSPSTPILAA